MNSGRKNQRTRLKRCKPCEGEVSPKTGEDIRKMLTRLPGWSYEAGEIVKTFSFENYYETVSFVNAVAWIAHRENHHPAVEFGYRTCRVRYSTHSIRGISDNDFLCAARINLLMAD